MTTATLPRPQQAARTAKAKPANVCRWLRRPTPTTPGAMDWTGVLDINGTVYALAGTNHSDEDTGRHFLMVDFRHCRGGVPTHHRVILADGESTCDCPWASYRPDEKECRHRLALKAALAWLEERERLEGDAAAARLALERQGAEAPF